MSKTKSIASRRSKCVTYGLIQNRTNDFNWLLIGLQLVSRSEQKQGEQEDYISYEEFSKVHLKIGKVIKAEGVPGMKKVFKIRVDIGADQRDLVVGAAPFYKPEELVGKVVVVCTNLEPKKIGGIVSNGMLLAADGPEGRPIFVTVAEEDYVVIGAVIK
jgi:methionine--tRNA ligase beta chain